MALPQVSGLLCNTSHRCTPLLYLRFVVLSLLYLHICCTARLLTMILRSCHEIFKEIDDR